MTPLDSTLEPGPPSGGGSPRPRPPSRPMRRTALTVAAVAVGAVAITLIVRGSQTTAPPPAPSPAQVFSLAAPPPDLLPEDEIPARAAAPDAPVAAIEPGDASRPPMHAGAWTYAGSDRLFIRSLGVEAPIDLVGVDNGAMVVPADVQRVGRWQEGAAIGSEAGTVLIVGHVNIAGQGPGALYNVHRIQAGAVIVTTDSAGDRSSWRVTGVESVDKQALPPDIFDADGPRRLVLVTCGGALLHVAGPNGGYNTYENNIVVRAEPA